jgi:hypothetical protein
MLDHEDLGQRDGRDYGEGPRERRDEDLAALPEAAAAAASGRARSRSPGSRRLLLVKSGWCVTRLPVALLPVALLPVGCLLLVPLLAAVALLAVPRLVCLGAVPVGAVSRRTVRLLPVPR